MVHVEATFGDSPVDRCDGLMRIYGVAVRGVEPLPNALQVDVYRAVRHYLGAIWTAGTTEAKAVVGQMNMDPIKDVPGDGGRFGKTVA